MRQTYSISRNNDDFCANEAIKPTTSEHLKEIANRLKKLSFRDMTKLSHLLAAQCAECPAMSDALLATADALEG